MEYYPNNPMNQPNGGQVRPPQEASNLTDPNSPVNGVEDLGDGFSSPYGEPKGLRPEEPTNPHPEIIPDKPDNSNTGSLNPVQKHETNAQQARDMASDWKHPLDGWCPPPGHVDPNDSHSACKISFNKTKDWFREHLPDCVAGHVDNTPDSACRGGNLDDRPWLKYSYIAAGAVALGLATGGMGDALLGEAGAAAVEDVMAAEGEAAGDAALAEGATAEEAGAAATQAAKQAGKELIEESKTVGESAAKSVVGELDEGAVTSVEESTVAGSRVTEAVGKNQLQSQSVKEALAASRPQVEAKAREEATNAAREAARKARAQLGKAGNDTQEKEFAEQARSEGEKAGKEAYQKSIERQEQELADKQVAKLKAQQEKNNIDDWQNESNPKGKDPWHAFENERHDHNWEEYFEKNGKDFNDPHARKEAWDEASGKAKQKLHDTGELEPKSSKNPFTPDKGGDFTQEVTMNDGTVAEVQGTVLKDGTVRISDMWIPK